MRGTVLQDTGFRNPKEVQNIEFDIEFNHLPMLVRTGLIDLLDTSTVKNRRPGPRFVFVYDSLDMMMECFRWLSDEKGTEPLLHLPRNRFLITLAAQRFSCA